jgi:hypothetical protein
MLIQELLALREATIDQALSDKLDQKAGGADEVTLNGKKYVRTGPKNAISQPGPWRLARG